jgi:hypothetical protein
MNGSEYTGPTHACAGPGCIGEEHRVTQEDLKAACEETAYKIEEFVTRDSGERKQFAGGGQRDTETGKIDYTLGLDGPMFKRYCALMTRGAQKYEARNWMKFKDEETLERAKRSLARHFMQYIAGELDEDHAAAIIFNLNVIERVSKILGKHTS